MYDQFLPPDFEPYGCFADDITDRAIPELVENYRDKIDWKDPMKVVEMCHQVTLAKGR